MKTVPMKLQVSADDMARICNEADPWWAGPGDGAEDRWNWSCNALWGHDFGKFMHRIEGDGERFDLYAGGRIHRSNLNGHSFYSIEDWGLTYKAWEQTSLTNWFRLPEQQESLRESLKDLVKFSHGLHREAGLWGTLPQGPIPKEIASHKILHTLTKCSEALTSTLMFGVEGGGETKENIEKRMVEALVRIFDLSGALGLDLSDAFIGKLLKNGIRQPDIIYKLPGFGTTFLPMNEDGWVDEGEASES